MNGVGSEVKISKYVVLCCLIVLVAAAFGYASYQQTRSVAMERGEKVYVQVKPGMNAAKIADLLYEKGLVDSVIGFRIVAKMDGLDNSLKAGDYALYRGMGYREIIAELVEGKSALFNIMVPEGYTVEQIATLMESRNIAGADEVRQLARDFAPYPYITQEKDCKYRVEGFLFPDTYQVADTQTAQDVFMVMIEQFDRQFTPEMRERAKTLNLTIREVVILASLVEREAQVDEDRPIIAQVFINRIREEMPLQSCATVQYILGTPKVDLSIQDTEIESPYNTYQHMGLPPGPISNPGIASIKAVLFSEPTEYLYFVADKDGKHHFSKTYDEHLNAIDRIG